MFKLKSARETKRAKSPGKEQSSLSIANLIIGDVSFSSDGKALLIEEKSAKARIAIGVENLSDLMQYLSNLSGRCERRAFRVPIHDSFGLQVKVDYPDEAGIPGKVRDISYIGALVELAGGRKHDLPVDSQLSVEFSLEGVVYRSHAVIKRAAENGYGLMFPESFKDSGSIDPPDPLLKMVRRLEERWVSSRMQSH